MTTYGRKNVAFTKGDGVWLWDQNNEQYLDALSGIAVCGLGHAHPKIAQAISTQAQTLLHTSNIYRIPAQEELSNQLCAISHMECAFFCNSGAEANEAAIKLARLHGHAKNIATPTVIVFENSFHGRTMATLTATGNRKAHAGFEPLVPGFIRAPYNDVATITQICQTNKSVVAILIEPIQGEGGIQVPDPKYLPALRSLCDEHDLLLILDEVQTGNGRTGKWFAFQHTSITPDILTTAKGLGNGLPIGACLTQGKASTLFTPGSHGSTFGGNPLACSVALAVLNVIKENALLDHVEQVGKYLLKNLQDKLSTHPLVKEVRGKGLMIGIELTIPCAQLVDLALAHKLLLNVTADSVIRLLPPLIITQGQANHIANTVVQCIAELEQTS